MEVNNSGFWDIAYRDNSPALLGVLRRYVCDVNIAQDLLHEVFITAIDKYDSYAGKGSFEGWLYKIAVNAALAYLRNEQNRQIPAEAVLSAIDDDDDNDRQIDEARATIEAAEFSDEELLAAIDRLPKHHKLVFNMYVMDDFSHKQIGSELNISPGTSKSHLARARKKIQKLLYEDALNRKNKKERRWASAFLALFTVREHFIDRLYRDGLSDFKIPPTGGAEFLSTALEQHAASVMSTTIQSTASVVTQTAFWGGKLSYIVACCGTAAVTGSICWLSMSVNSPLNRDNDLANINNDMVTISDTLIYSPIIPEADNTIFNAASSDSLNSIEAEYVSSEPINSDSSEKIAEPVVVTKQIIQHQTVVVRDTVFIFE